MLQTRPLRNPATSLRHNERTRWPRIVLAGMTFGFSLGGLVAYAVALSAPTRIGKLTSPRRTCRPF